MKLKKLYVNNQHRKKLILSFGPVYKSWLSRGLKLISGNAIKAILNQRTSWNFAGLNLQHTSMHAFLLIWIVLWMSLKLNFFLISYSLDSDSLTSLMLFTFELVPSHLVFIVISVETSSNSSTFWEKHFVKPVNIRVTQGCRLDIIFHTVGFQMNTRKMKNPRSMFKTPTMLRNIWK